MIVLGMAVPLGTIVALGAVAGDRRPEDLERILVGAVVIAVMFENQNKVANHFSFMRLGGMLDYFGTLPIRRWALILAVVLSFFALSLPALGVTLVAGTLILDVPLSLSPLLAVVLPLAAASMAAVGALVGVTARNSAEANAVSLLIAFLMAGLGAVVLPPDRVPEIAVHLGWLSPATYAASALRETMIGPVTTRFVVDVAALVAFTVVTFWITSRKMDWRQE